MSVKEQLLSAVSSTKTGATVATATAGTSLGTIFNYIPDDIGKVGVLVGIILSVVICRFHLVNIKKANLEIEIMRRRETDRLKSLERRED